MPNASILTRVLVLSAPVICNIVSLKLRGCCIPLALPTILNADCVFANEVGGLILVNPNLSTVNALCPAGVFTVIGRLNMTLPVAVVVPIRISRAGLAILI